MVKRRLSLFNDTVDEKQGIYVDFEVYDDSIEEENIMYGIQNVAYAKTVKEVVPIAKEVAGWFAAEFDENNFCVQG